jgi:hypothetical protein
MKPIPLNPETQTVATKVIWFESAEDALADPIRFMAYAMTYALPEDMRAIRRYVSDDDFREALDHAPPGIIDPRSWAYWNSKMGRYPPPPMTRRCFGADVVTAGAARGYEATSAHPRSAEIRDPAQRRRQSAQDWAQLREQRGPAPSAEEMRHRAAQEWNEKFGPGKKT